MKIKIFCMLVLCTGLLVGCDKEEEYKPVIPPVEEPDKPVTPPSTDDIIKTKIGDINMIVGSNSWIAIVKGEDTYHIPPKPLYVAVGSSGSDGYITSSYDGVTWGNPIKSPVTTNWKSVAYGNGKFVAVGYNGYVTASIAGVSWTTPKMISSVNWESVAYGNGKFVVVGSRNGDSYSAIVVMR